MSESDSLPQGWEPQDCLTRAEMARLMGRDEQAVKRDEKKHGLQTGMRDGRVVVNVHDFVRIGRIKPEDLAGLSAGEAAEVLRLRQQVSQLTAEVGELRGSLVEVRGSRDLAIAQIAVKDNQLKIQGEHLTKLLVLAQRSAA